MIDVIKQTPAEYSTKSRDYQIIARLYSALFNISKMYIDDLEIWNNNIDNKLTDLRARTLNFVADHTWDLDDLEAVTSCFKYLMKYKGTKEAIIACINILMRINLIDGTVGDDTVILDDQFCLQIKLESGLVTMGVLEDLLKYVLPAGMTYRIYQYKSYNYNGPVYTDIYTRKDKVNKTNSWTVEEYNDTEKPYIGTNASGQEIGDTFVYNAADGDK